MSQWIAGLRRFVLIVGLVGLLAGTGGGKFMSDVLAPYAEEVDRSVDRGLNYLASVQTEKGFFPGNYGRAPAVVSLAGMAFLAAGHTPGREPHGETINRCIDYVISCQREGGYITARKGRDRGMYSHNIASLFLSEVSGMVDPQRQQKLDVALPKALKVIVSAQNVNKPSTHAGGWRYKPTSRDSDMSCSGWALMALRSARLNGARVADENIERAVKYVLSKQNPKNGGFGYQNSRGPRMSLTGAGVLCLELSGYHGTKEMKKAERYIANNYKKIPGRWESYALYYNSQAAFQVGGKLWEDFADWMYARYLKQQRPDGSWPADRRVGAPYHTAMKLLSFTVPYRQLPIYQRDETVDEDPYAAE